MLFFKKAKKEFVPPAPKNLEVLSAGMEIFNHWYKKEFLLEFVKLIKTLNVKDVKQGSFSSAFMKEIYDPEYIQDKISKINAQIIIRMSDSIYGLFCASYNADYVMEYMARQALFFIKKIITDITSIAATNKDVKYDDIIDEYFVILENTNYILNDIQTLEGVPSYSNESPSGSEKTKTRKR